MNPADSFPQSPQGTPDSTPVPLPPSVENGNIGYLESDLFNPDGNLNALGKTMVGSLFAAGVELNPYDQILAKHAVEKELAVADQIKQQQAMELAKARQAAEAARSHQSSSAMLAHQAEKENKPHFMDGTNIKMDSKIAEFIAENPDFPVPTWASTLDDSPEYDSLNVADKIRQSLWSHGFQFHEAFWDTRSNESEQNAKTMEYLKRCEETGDDSQIRALYAVETEPGSGVYVDLYNEKTTYTPATVKDAWKTFGVNHHDFQSVMWYELINKAQNEGDFKKAMFRSLEILSDGAARGPADPKGPRWSEGQIMGTLKGVEFMGKAQHLSFKYANISWNEEGRLEYAGIKGADFVREMTGKFQGYSVGGLSPVDAANAAALAEAAFFTSIDYARLEEDDPHRPSEMEKNKAQFVLQGFALQVAGMRMGMAGGGEMDDAQRAMIDQQRMQEMRNQLESSSSFQNGVQGVEIDPRTGELILPPDAPQMVAGMQGRSAEKVRTGGAAKTTPIWEQIALYADKAVELFPNLLGVDAKEMGPVYDAIEKNMDRIRSEHGSSMSEEEMLRARRSAFNEATGLKKHKYNAPETPKARRKANRAAVRRRGGRSYPR